MGKESKGDENLAQAQRSKEGLGTVLRKGWCSVEWGGDTKLDFIN